MNQLLAVILAIFFPAMAWAQSAEMVLTPTRVVIDKDTRYATVSVKNSGDGIGRYRVELVDTNMQEDGGLKMLEGEETNPHSALTFLRASPRSITLRPGEYQMVRLLVKRPKDLADGEYRSHLKVRLAESNIDEATGQPVKLEEGISIQPRLVMVVPVFVQHGERSSTVSIDTVEAFVKGTQEYPMPFLKVDFSHEGNSSNMGDFVMYKTSGGQKTEVMRYQGIAIYREAKRRFIRIPFEKGKVPGPGQYVIEYHGQVRGGQEGELGPILASKDFSI